MTAATTATPSAIEPRDRDELSAFFGERVRYAEPLAPYTWWKIGGPADALISVETNDEVAFLMRLCLRRRLPWFVLGNGSNVLVGDGGMRGIVLRLGGNFGTIDFAEGDDFRVIVTAGASASLPQLVAQAASRGAIGIDGLAGVPGTVGGSLFMNAGTDREIGEFVREVHVQTLNKPDAHPVSVQYYYRHTNLERDAIVSRVVLTFERGEVAEVRERLQDRLIRRKATQPLQWANAGSCFRNPAGDKAGRLIEAVGAKGWRVGGAEVSGVHANFIVNTGGASALDVTALLARVRRAVGDEFGIDMQLEVHLVGEFVAEA